MSKFCSEVVLEADNRLLELSNNISLEKLLNDINHLEYESFNMVNAIDPENTLTMNNTSLENKIHFDSKLTKREHECLAFYVNGFSTKEIGKKLIVSPRTVETHLNNIKQKTGCTTRGTLRLFLSNY